MNARDAELVALTLYNDEQPDASGCLIATSELPRPQGWTLLQRLARCPNHCAGGELLEGGDLVDCHVCNGEGVVRVGVGGAYLMRSRKVAIPEEPTEFFYANDLRYFTAPPVEPEEPQ